MMTIMSRKLMNLCLLLTHLFIGGNSEAESIEDNGSVKNEPFKEDKYHLTERELFYLFGRMDNLPAYEVVPLSPVVIPKRRKRWLQDNENLRVNLTVLKSSLFLELWPNPQLTIPSIAVVKRSENGSEIPVTASTSIVEPHCYYHGRILQKYSMDNAGPPEYDGIVALDLCDGYDAQVKLKKQLHYRLDEFVDMFLVFGASPSRQSGIIATSNEHLVIRPIPVDHFSKRSINNARSQPHLIYRHDYVPGSHNCPSRPLHHGFPGQQDGIDGEFRGRRSIPNVTPTMAIETAIFIDRDLYEVIAGIFPNNAEAQTIKVVLTMVNAVQLIFNHRSLGSNLHLPVIRLEILNKEFKGLDRARDIDKFLTNFCQWQKGLNPASDDDPNHWDHALILTGLNLFTQNGPLPMDDRVVGLAPVSGMCLTARSCTINEGRHFEAVYVVAHEIGHSLGMQHDGLPHNSCDPESYIMSATLGGGKTSWSDCSRDYLQNFLSSPHAQCLRDSNAMQVNIAETTVPRLPGQRYNADQQCRLKFGRDSRRSRQYPLRESCHDLICQMGPFGEDAYAHPALEGTSCGPGKWCQEGVCVWKTDVALDGGWGNWSHYSGCASGCLWKDDEQSWETLKGIKVSSRQCERARNGQGKCSGRSRRHKLCDTKSVCASAQKKTVADYSSQACLKATIIDSSLTGKSLLQHVPPQTKCIVQCIHKNGTVTSLPILYPDGTPCGLTGQPESYCVNGRCMAFHCNDMNECIDLPNEEKNVTAWQTISKCHPSCVSGGKGLRLVHFSEGCTPETFRSCGRSTLQLCDVNQESCASVPTVQEFATSVCTHQAKLVPQIGPWGKQLPAVLRDPNRPCIVACRDARSSTRYYKMDVDSSGQFPTGTKCGGNKANAYCVQGKCKHFGEDGLLQEQDRL